MRAARRMKDDAAFQCQLRCGNRSADAGRGALEHAREHRVLHRADAMALSHFEVNPARLGGPPQSVHVIRSVEPGKLVHGGARTLAELGLIEPPQRAAKIHDRLHAGNRERMVAAVRGLPVDRVTDEERRESRVHAARRRERVGSVVARRMV